MFHRKYIEMFKRMKHKNYIEFNYEIVHTDRFRDSESIDTMIKSVRFTVFEMEKFLIFKIRQVSPPATSLKNWSKLAKK